MGFSFFLIYLFILINFFLGGGGGQKWVKPKRREMKTNIKVLNDKD